MTCPLAVGLLLPLLSSLHPAHVCVVYVPGLGFGMWGLWLRVQAVVLDWHHRRQHDAPDAIRGT